MTIKEIEELKKKAKSKVSLYITLDKPDLARGALTLYQELEKYGGTCGETQGGGVPNKCIVANFNTVACFCSEDYKKTFRAHVERFKYTLMFPRSNLKQMMRSFGCDTCVHGNMTWMDAGEDKT